MTAARRSIDEMLADARSRLVRLDPPAALSAQSAGAVLVDIRPPCDRHAEGELPQALVVDRNVLEWRLDPASPARLSIASYDLHVVLVCNEGYASSLAAAALQDLGIVRATDLIGGYRAWCAAGLPVTNGSGGGPLVGRRCAGSDSLREPVTPPPSPTPRWCASA